MEARAWRTVALPLIALAAVGLFIVLLAVTQANRPTAGAAIAIVLMVRWTVGAVQARGSRRPIPRAVRAGSRGARGGVLPVLRRGSGRRRRRAAATADAADGAVSSVRRAREVAHVQVRSADGVPGSGQCSPGCSSPRSATSTASASPSSWPPGPCPRPHGRRPCRATARCPTPSSVGHARREHLRAPAQDLGEPDGRRNATFRRPLTSPVPHSRHQVRHAAAGRSPHGGCPPASFAQFRGSPPRERRRTIEPSHRQTVVTSAERHRDSSSEPGGLPRSWAHGAPNPGPSPSSWRCRASASSRGEPGGRADGEPQ
jgi:hypothetical protein